MDNVAPGPLEAVVAWQSPLPPHGAWVTWRGVTRGGHVWHVAPGASPTRGLAATVVTMLGMWQRSALSAAARRGQRGFVFRSKGLFDNHVMWWWSPDKMVEGGGGRASSPWSEDWCWCDRGRGDVSVSKLCDSSITCHEYVTNLSLRRWCPLLGPTATESLQNTRFVWIMSGIYYKHQNWLFQMRITCTD